MSNEIPEAMEVSLLPQPGSPWPKSFQIESSTKADEFYTVEILDEGGFATCTCKGFSYRHRCRHTQDARERVFGKAEVAEQYKPVEDVILVEPQTGEEMPVRSQDEMDDIMRELWG